MLRSGRVLVVIVEDPINDMSAQDGQDGSNAGIQMDR